MSGHKSIKLVIFSLICWTIQRFSLQWIDYSKLIIITKLNSKGGLPVNLDRTDFALLSAMQQNARISNKELAQSVGIAPSTCLERVRRLQSMNAILGFRTEVAPDALGIGIQAMISLRISQHARVSFDQLREELITLHEAVSVYVLAGTQDILVHVAVKDVQHLRTLVDETFTARGDVAHIETWLIFDHARSNELPNYGM